MDFVFDGCTEVLLNKIIESSADGCPEAKNLLVQLSDFQKVCIDMGLCPKGELVRGYMCRNFQRDAVQRMWWLFALGSAVFAALTSILAKIGIEGVNSNLATAIRTVVVVIMAWGMVFLTHAQDGLSGISRKSWLFLILSGLATGASWLCYYKALQLGEVSKVVPIDKLSVLVTLALAFLFLHERFTVKSLVGCLLIGVGTLVMAL